LPLVARQEDPLCRWAQGEVTNPGGLPWESLSSTASLPLLSLFLHHRETPLMGGGGCITKTSILCHSDQLHVSNVALAIHRLL
jgi:hypothetical protein